MSWGMIIALLIISWEILYGEERTLNLDEWISQTHCTRLISTRMEGKEKKYIVDDRRPGERVSQFEIEELTKALDTLYPINDKQDQARRANQPHNQ